MLHSQQYLSCLCAAPAAEPSLVPPTPAATIRSGNRTPGADATAAVAGGVGDESCAMGESPFNIRPAWDVADGATGGGVTGLVASRGRPTWTLMCRFKLTRLSALNEQYGHA